MLCWDVVCPTPQIASDELLQVFPLQSKKDVHVYLDINLEFWM